MIHSDNYDDITFKVHIILTDRISNSKKKEPSQQLKEVMEYIDGQTISDLKIKYIQSQICKYQTAQKCQEH